MDMYLQNISAVVVQTKTEMSEKVGGRITLSLIPLYGFGQ